MRLIKWEIKDTDNIWQLEKNKNIQVKPPRVTSVIIYKRVFSLTLNKFLEQQFSNFGEADSSPFTYSGQRVANFDPREQYAMDLARFSDW
jgi:hypothetical protein